MRKGFSLMEIIVSIGIVAFMLAVYTTTLSTLPLANKEKRVQQAYRLAEQEMEKLKALGFIQLTNQTNGPLRHVAYPLGQILVQTDAAAFSAPNILRIENSVSSSQFSGLAVLPGEKYDDFTFSARVKIATNPPANWQSGLAFRYQDDQNYYWFYLNATSINLKKTVAGQTSTLFTQNTSINTNAWYELKVNTAGNAITIYLDGTQWQSLSDPSLSFGYLALGTTQGLTGQFDNVQVIGGQTETYRFDSDTALKPPSGWRRLALSDLPGGAGTLTVENYNSADIKKITVKITWLEKNTSQEVKLVTLMAQ